MKQFDDIFREKVNTAFSNSDYSHLADAGWKAFVKKQKGGKKLAIIIPFWAKAATVALFISAGGVLLYKYQNDRELVIASYESHPDTKVNSEKISSDKGKSEKLRKTDSETVLQSEGNKPENIIVAQFVPQSESHIFKQQSLRNENEYENVTGDVDTVSKDNMESSSVNGENPGPEIAKANPLVSANPAEETVNERKTSLIAGFSGIMSEAGNMSSVTPGVSVGFFVDQKITRRISFRPGLALAKFAYGTVNVATSKVMYGAPADLSNSQASFDSYENKLDIVTMEIPMNMVFTILEKGKSSLFLSAGASTVVYLNQKFSGNYSGVFTNKYYDAVSGTYSNSTSTQSFRVASEEKAFSHVDYFGLANISAGYVLPVGKSRMLVEPFIQLPVSELTSLDLKIRNGGLSLKFLFGH